MYQIKKYFKAIGNPANVKYIDPTYTIRACRANASDGILCTVLGQNAVSFSFLHFPTIISNIIIISKQNLSQVGKTHGMF